MKGIISLSITLFGTLLITSCHSTNAFQASNHQNNLSEQKLYCVKHCHGDGNHDHQDDEKFIKFDSNKSYLYDVKILNQVQAIVNQSQDLVETNLVQIDGQAKFSPLNHCEVSMVLKNVHLDFFDRSSNFEIERYIRQFQTPIIFSYKDGIVTEVCSPTTTDKQEETENSFVINVKKSIISAMQTVSNILDDDHYNQTTKQQMVVETDYHGECETTYQIKKHDSNDKYSVVKEKNLLKCQNVDESSEFSDLGYIVKESNRAISKCQQEIESKHVVKSECRSTHSLISKNDNFNIELIAKIQLAQKSIQDNTFQHKDLTKKTILEHGQWSRNIYRLNKHPEVLTSSDRKSEAEQVELRPVIQKICQDIQYNYNRVSLTTIKYVERLAQAFQAINDSNQINSVWNEIHQGQNICDEQTIKKMKDIFVDTAASVFNEYTGPIVRDELLRLYEKQSEDILAKERARNLATSLAFTQNPSLEAVKKIVPELLSKIEDSNIILSISALVKQTQQQHQQANSTEIKEQIYKIILDKIISKVNDQNGKQVTEVDIVRLLKSLENISPRTMISEQDKLIEIISGQKPQNQINDTELIRSTAIKSMQAVQLNQNARKTLLTIFSNNNETNEIRINSYRTLINTGTNVEELKQILQVIQQQNSTNNHVYNYVCSHQKILRSTRDQPKRESLPSDAPEFPEPASIMKFYLSRHYEYYYDVPKSSFGSIVETDVIMADGDYGFPVPRSITFNFTLPIDSKQQIPIAELQIRQKGHEGRITKKMLNSIMKLFSQNQKINAHLMQQLKNIIDENTNDQQRQFQLQLNIDGKNIFVFDSRDQQVRLTEVWNWIKEKFPVKIDETRVVMPWRKRVVITQIASGVPMYFEINSTYIGSFDAFVIKQQPGNEHYLEMMLKPTVVAESNIAIGNVEQGGDRSVPMTNQFRIVNQVMSAPTIHFKSQIKDNKQISLTFILPEHEQSWWRSVTKIIKGTGHFKNTKHSLDKDLKSKCIDSTMKLLGVSLCYKNKKIDSLSSVQSKGQPNEEILVDYNEISLKKQNEQIQGIELTLELPEAILSPVFATDKNEMKFGFNVSTVENESSMPRIYSEMIIHVPTEQKDQLTAQFTVGVLNKSIHGIFELVDNGEQKTMKLELMNERNTTFFQFNADGKFKDTFKISKINYNINVQPIGESRIYEGKGMISHEQNDVQNQNKVQFKFESNGQQMADVLFVQNGKFDEMNHQITLNSMINMLGLKMKYRWLYNKDQKTIKSISKVGYNRFWSTTHRDHFETCEIEYQSSIYDSSTSGQQNIIKRYLLYKMISSQYPQINVELSYNQKIQPDSNNYEEFVLKYGNNFERNQLRIDQTTQTIQNKNAGGTARIENKMNFEFRPKDIFYVITSVTDVSETDSKKQATTAIQVHDRKRSEKVMESQHRLDQQMVAPFLFESSGEMKFFRPQPYVVSYKHKAHLIQNQPDKFRGKIEVSTVPETDYIPEMLPKVLQIQYDFHTNDKLPINNIHDIFTRFGKYQHELFFENDKYGHMGHMSLLESINDRRQIKAAMRREGEQVYKINIIEGVINSNDKQHNDKRHFKFMFDTIHYNQLKVDGEVQWENSGRPKREIKGHLNLENEFYDHSTAFNVKKDGSYDFDTKTKHQDRLIFSMKNQLYRKEQDIQQVTLEFQLPKFNLDHESKIQILNASDKVIADSITRYHERNLLKLQLNAQSKLGQVKAEFGGDLKGQLKIEKIDDQTFQLNTEFQNSQQQIMHQSKALFKRYPEQVPFWKQYQLISVDMKNSLSGGHLIDVHYKHNQDDQYQHQLTTSTRLSYGQLLWSNSKALIVFKTKHLQGIDHKTELYDIVFPSFKINSNTIRDNKKFLQIVGDINMKKGQKTNVEMVIGEDEHQVQMEIIPSKQINCNFQSKNGQVGNLEWIRSNPKQWSMNVKGENRKKRSSEWKVNVEHKCDEYTKIQGESTLVNGELEHNVNERSLDIELNGKKNEQFEDFKHETQIKWGHKFNQLKIESETRKSGQKVISIEVDYNPNLFKFDTECYVKQFPIELKTLLNVNERHVKFAVHDKKQDRRAHFETKANGWKDFKFQCAWGQDDNNQILFKSDVQPKNGKAQMKGQWFQHKLEGEIQSKQNGDKGDLCNGQYKLKLLYADNKTKQEKFFNLKHRCNKNQKGLYESFVECRNGQINVIKGHCRLDIRDKRSIDFELKTESDLKGIWSNLNCEAKLSHQFMKNRNGNDYQQRGFVQFGLEDNKKSLRLSGDSDSSAIVYQLVSSSPSTTEKFVKFEWNKPEQKLQMNVYDENGRIVDVNVDVLAKSLQKKLQIVSFTNYIPTVDVEAVFGENSHLVFALSFQQEKKLELNLNWFGQWRHDYRADVLFRSYAEPQLEMMIVSHHPATFDNIDAVLKYKNREIKAKWNDRFDDETKQQREAMIEVNGRRAIHLSVNRKQEQDSKSPNQDIIYYEGRLNGDYQAQGNAKVVINKSPEYAIKMIKVEIDKPSKTKRNADQQKQAYNTQHFMIELFFRHQERPEAPQVSGINIERENGKPVFVATYVEPAPIPIDDPEPQPSTVNTLAHLYLPGGIDYQLYNEINYENNKQHKIKQVKSDLRKKQITGQTVSLMKMNVFYYREDNEPETKVVRVEIGSPIFPTKVKIFKLRYNMNSTSHCRIHLQREQDQAKCSQVQFIFGDENVTRSRTEMKPVSVTFELGEKHLENDFINRTALFSVETLNEPNKNRVLNFTIIGQISSESFGYKWNNIDRYGNKKSGQFFTEFKSEQNTTGSKTIDLLYQFNDEKNDEESLSYQVHLQTHHFFKNSYIKFKWDLLKLIKKLINGKVPRIEELSRRTDICELSNRIVREIKDEILYKWRLFKRQTSARDVINAVLDEIHQVRHQMKYSHDPIANKIVEYFDELLEKMEEIVDRIDIERFIDEVLARINQIIKQIKNRFIHIVEKKCFENEKCHKLYRRIRDYEIRHIMKASIEKFQDYYVPKSLQQAFKDFQQDQQQQQHETSSDNIFVRMKHLFEEKSYHKNICQLFSCPELLSEIIDVINDDYKKQQPHNKQLQYSTQNQTDGKMLSKTVLENSQSQQPEEELKQQQQQNSQNLIKKSNWIH